LRQRLTCRVSNLKIMYTTNPSTSIKAVAMRMVGTIKTIIRLVLASAKFQPLIPH